MRFFQQTIWILLILILLFYHHTTSIYSISLYTEQKRFGIDIGICPRMDQTDIDILEKEVGVGWYMNWNLSQWEKYGGNYKIEHTPLVGVWPNLNHFNTYDNFRQAIDVELNASPDSYPDGTTWIIGNEIGYTPQFEDYPPETYVNRFRRYRGYINRLGTELNRSYRLAMGSVLPLDQFHSGGRTGIQYVRDVLIDYENRFGEKMPLDVFTIDPYVYPPYEPTNVNRFKEMIIDFRQMMTNRGYRDKELWLKEWGNLWHEGYPPTSVALGAQYVLDTVNWMLTATSSTTGMPRDDNRLVQRWAWFVYNDGDRAWDCGDLLGAKYNKMYNSSTNTLSQIGINYKNLLAEHLIITPTLSLFPSLTVTLTVTPIITQIPTNTPFPTSNNLCLKKIRGDADCDDQINGIDFSLWLNSQCHPSGNQQCSNIRADFDSDGSVDDTDYNIWFMNRYT